MGSTRRRPRAAALRDPPAGQADRSGAPAAAALGRAAPRAARRWSPVLAFDIETIPDVAGLRLLRGADAAASDADVYAAEIADRAARNKSDFMPLYLQRVLVISCVFRGAEGLQVRSFVDLERDGKSEEAGVIQAFFDRVDEHRPQLVSWNGGGFDLPVLQQRGLRHGVVAGRYWDMGDGRPRVTATTTTSAATTCVTST